MVNSSGKTQGMAAIILKVAESKPDGIVVSLPSSEALGAAINKAVGSSIPVITINSDFEDSARYGVLLHVG